MTFLLSVPILITNSCREGDFPSINTQFALAIHTLTLLAQAQDEPLTSELIAGSINSNSAFIRRILGQLARAGFVNSQPGMGGGWRLRRDPATLTLLEVYRAVDERHLLALHHSPPNPDCLVGRNIQRSLELYFGEAEQAFAQTLAGRTIAQVLETVREDSSSPTP